MIASTPNTSNIYKRLTHRLQQWLNIQSVFLTSVELDIVQSDRVREWPSFDTTKVFDGSQIVLDTIQWCDPLYKDICKVNASNLLGTTCRVMLIQSVYHYIVLPLVMKHVNKFKVIKIMFLIKI